MIANGERGEESRSWGWNRSWRLRTKPEWTRVAFGAGQFGKNHCRVVHESARAELRFVVDRDAARAAESAAPYRRTGADGRARTATGKVDAAVVAGADYGARRDRLPAAGSRHRRAGGKADRAGPGMPPTGWSEAAERNGRILQVGHLERFNPAVIALKRRATLPLFFEIHRMNLFSPRSLDVDVVLDLMIHDVDIVLALAKAEPQEIRAAGISILSTKVDIANVRLQFPNGCVANLTASRVSTERVRKLRLFQPHQYLSLDYGRQDLAIFSVGADRQIGFEQAPVTQGEPLKLQFDAFLDCVETRNSPKSSGRGGASNFSGCSGDS